jgi:hypothetical protein
LFWDSGSITWHLMDAVQMWSGLPL